MATDPNEVRLIGENSFMKLTTGEGGEPTTSASHWRVLVSPAGMGHVLYLKSDLTNNEPRVYADNVALARWLQDDIFGLLVRRLPRPPYARGGGRVLQERRYHDLLDRERRVRGGLHRPHLVRLRGALRIYSGSGGEARLRPGRLHGLRPGRQGPANAKRRRGCGNTHSRRAGRKAHQRLLPGPGGDLGTAQRLDPGER